MVWRENSVNKERMLFISEWLKKEHKFNELCERFGISRKTGYKWVNRYNSEGESALLPRTSAPHHCPHKTDNMVIEKILAYKYRYPTWGPMTLKAKLEKDYPLIVWPAVSTMGEILKEHGLVKPRRKRRKTPPYSEPFLTCNAPNKVWSADFKGQFKLSNGKLCYPLTITDNYSRLIIACEALPDIKVTGVIPVFKRVFQEYGLPEAIRTDNGTPFSSTSPGGLSQLSLWWLKLGIKPERIKAGRPDQNGRHERMHRTLKEATCNPPADSMRAQIKRFKKFVHEFNYERPHQGINQRLPSDCHLKSSREYTGEFSEITYPDNFVIRKVRSNGEIKWQGKLIYVSELFYGEPVGLEPIDEDRALLSYSSVKLGMVDLKKRKLIRPR